jgi:hypothetical protein
MPIEVVVKDEEIAIYIDRKRLLGWLRDVPGALDGESPVPWEGDSTDDKKDSGSTTDASGPQGYRTGDGTQKEFPNPVGDTNPDDLPEPDDTSEEPVDGIDLFEEGPTGQKGTLQDAPDGKKKIKELRDWIKGQKFNYRNFCQFLYDMDEVAGFKLRNPLIGVTQQKKEPTLLQVAFRFYSYWLSAKEEIAKQYKRYLIIQLEDLGIKIELVKDVLDGEEIDPKNLPKGIEVSV